MAAAAPPPGMLEVFVLSKRPDVVFFPNTRGDGDVLILEGTGGKRSISSGASFDSYIVEKSVLASMSSGSRTRSDFFRERPCVDELPSVVVRFSGRGGFSGLLDLPDLDFANSGLPVLSWLSAALANFLLGGGELSSSISPDSESAADSEVER